MYFADKSIESLRLRFKGFNLFINDTGKRYHLFLAKRKKHISARTLQDIFKQAADELDIDKHLHAHLFRHTAATHLNKVSDIAITQHALGHMRSSNTHKYAHLNPDQYAFYMQKHPYVCDFKTPEVTL